LPDADASRHDDLSLLTEAAGRAADLAMGFFRRDPQVWLKGNSSPVSEADYAVDRFLKAELTAARPGYGWLSEETEDAAHRLDLRRVFVVDPIDGTRGFLAGSNEWTISLALVEDGQPVVAALVQPTTGTLFSAVAGSGAWRNGTTLAMGPAPSFARARVAGPSAFCTAISRHQGTGRRGGYVASLALRIAMVADGRLDLALAKANAHDWDVAAADLILAEAGGALIGPGGTPLAYNRRDTRHPVLAAGPPALSRQAIDIVAPTPA
jgi:myo-inositol-1(or 4)-monophosphatase